MQLNAKYAMHLSIYVWIRICMHQKNTSQILEHDFLHFRCYYLLSISFALSQEYLHNVFVVSERQKER